MLLVKKHKISQSHSPNLKYRHNFTYNNPVKCFKCSSNSEVKLKNLLFLYQKNIESMLKKQIRQINAICNDERENMHSLSN